MGSEYQPGPPESKGLEIALVLLGVNVAWPALLVGVVARFLIQQRTRNPFPYWIAAGGLGAVGPTGCATRLQQTSRVARSSSRAHPVLSLPCERLRRNAPSSRKHNSNEGRSRAASVKCLSRCTSHGKIHAFESRTNYQKIVMRFLNWCRDQHNMRDLAH